MKCPRCDLARQPEELECANCGAGFDYSVPESGHSPEPGGPAPPEEEAASGLRSALQADTGEGPAENAKLPSSDPVGDQTKACPKCGYPNTGQTSECLRCGIIFYKYEVYLEKQRRAVEETNQTTDSLLDSETFKMAAEASRQNLPTAVYARTACPHCAQRYKIRTDQVGILTRCKKCSSIFKIEQLPDITP